MREVGRQHRAADMLEHADRGDLVPRFVFRQRAVVEQLHLHAALQPALVDQRLTCACWFFDSVMPVALHAVVLGRPQQQAAPAGADVEEALALAQHQLAADMVELGLLRLRQRHAGVAVVGARVDAPRRRATEHRNRPTRRSETAPGARRPPRCGGPRLGVAQQLAPPRRTRAARRRVGRGSSAPRRHDVAHVAVDLEAPLDVVTAPAGPPGRRRGAPAAPVRARSASPRRRRRPTRRPPGSTTAVLVCRLANLRSIRLSMGFMATHENDGRGMTVR